MSNQRNAFVRQYISNYHETQKWMWTILMVFSLYEATTELVKLLPDSFRGLLSFQFTPSALFYLAFLLLIYRFFVGDSRIVDYFYDALPSAFAEKDEQFNAYVATLEPRLLFMDGVVRVIQYLFFVAAAVNVGKPAKFALITAVLLLVNALFSGYVLHSVKQMDKGERSKKIKGLIEQVFVTEPLDFDACRRVWLNNNLIFGVLVLILLIFGDDFFDSVNSYLEIQGSEFYTVAILLMVNSWIDLKKCDHIYRPRFHELLADKREDSEG